MLSTQELCETVLDTLVGTGLLEDAAELQRAFERHIAIIRRPQAPREAQLGVAFFQPSDPGTFSIRLPTGMSSDTETALREAALGALFAAFTDPFLLAEAILDIEETDTFEVAMQIPPGEPPRSQDDFLEDNSVQVVSVRVDRGSLADAQSALGELSEWINEQREGV